MLSLNRQRGLLVAGDQVRSGVCRHCGGGKRLRRLQRSGRSACRTRPTRFLKIVNTTLRRRGGTLNIRETFCCFECLLGQQWGRTGICRHLGRAYSPPPLSSSFRYVTSASSPAHRFCRSSVLAIVVPALQRLWYILLPTLRMLLEHYYP